MEQQGIYIWVLHLSKNFENWNNGILHYALTHLAGGWLSQCTKGKCNKLLHIVVHSKHIN